MGNYLDKLRRFEKNETKVERHPAPAPTLPAFTGEGVNAKPDWLAAWRDVAQITSGLTAEDPRLQPVLAGLSACDRAFEGGDWDAFQTARTALLTVMKGQPGDGLGH